MWYPAIAPASAPTPPRTAPLAGGSFTVACMAAPQIAPDTIRQASGAASKRLRVKGNLSVTSSLSANSAILLEAPAETILAYGECPGRIQPRLRLKASIARAVIGRRPATMPIPVANRGAPCCFILVSRFHYNSAATVRGDVNDQELAPGTFHCSVSLMVFPVDCKASVFISGHGG